MRKNSILLIALLSLVIITVACGSPTITATPSESASQPSNASVSDDLSAIAGLAVGTLELEDTDQSVTVEQAAELLTLWQAYQSLSASGTAAQAELDAVTHQIRATMTDSQLQAIEEMQLTRQAMAEALQSRGSEAPVSSTNLSGTSTDGQTTSSGGPGAPLEAGNPPTGGGPDGGGEMLMGDPGLDGQSATDTASQGTRQTSDVSPMLLQVLIQVLEAKTQSAR